MAWFSWLDAIVKLWHDILFYVSFSFTLINTFGAGTKWIARSVRLFLFVLMLFFPMMSKLYHYITNDKVLRQIAYGPNKRNSLDIYLVHANNLGKDRCPVVLYVGGGGWTVGYRMWALLMEKFFTDQGIVLLSVDYRNFPQGTISEMLTDVNMALSWTIENVSKFGGDPENVHVVGQSAGSHLVLLAAVDQAARECFIYKREKGMLSSSSYGSNLSLLGEKTPRTPPPPPVVCTTDGLLDVPVGGKGKGSPMNGFGRRSAEQQLALERSLALSLSQPPRSWHLSNVRSIICLSGPFDINYLVPHLHNRGLYRQVMYCIMEGELTHNSPYARVQKRTFLENNSAELLPPIYLLHGDVDETIPYNESIKMKDVLEKAGAKCNLKIYKGKNHTDAVMEDMFSGNNTMLRDVVTLVKEGWEGVEKKEGGDEDLGEREVDNWRIVIARYVNPF